MKKQKLSQIKKEPKVTQGIAIAAFILNLILFPGLGTLVAGKTKIGVWQLALGIISIPLMLILIGIPLFIGIWIWGIVTGIQIIRESDKR